MNIYVDVDGTLLSGKLDDTYKQKLASNGYVAAQVWYQRVYIDDLDINERLVHYLRLQKKKGNNIFLWTDRGEPQRKMTVQNLHRHCAEDLFSGFIFYAGQKKKAKVDGLVIDNEIKYRFAGTDFKHVEFKE